MRWRTCWMWIVAALLGLGGSGAIAADSADSFVVTLPTAAQPATYTVAPANQPAGDSTGDLAADPAAQPLMLSTSSDDQGVYTLPEPPTAAEGTNLGGVHMDISVAYFNHYMYRGVDHSIGAQSNILKTKASTLNLQGDGRLDFDFGKLPHPYVGLFADIYDDDPVSRFQEIRPYYGLDWTIKPFTFEGGGTTFIYPDREPLNTAEFDSKIAMDDSFLFHTDKPMLSPYFMAAYDYHRNNGWYMEAGISHDIAIEDIGLDLTFQADMAYIIGYQQQFVFINTLHDTGFQHFDVGMKAAYSLNRLLNFSDRFGQFNILGFFFYTGKLNGDLTANNVLWGGAGIGFNY